MLLKIFVEIFLHAITLLSYSTGFSVLCSTVLVCQAFPGNVDRKKKRESFRPFGRVPVYFTTVKEIIAQFMSKIKLHVLPFMFSITDSECLSITGVSVTYFERIGIQWVLVQR